MFGLKAVSAINPESLRALVGDVRKVLVSLKAGSIDTNTWDPILKHLGFDQLDPVVRFRKACWDNHRRD